LQKVYNTIRGKKKKISPGVSTNKDREYREVPQEVDYRGLEQAPVRTRNEPLTYSRGREAEESYGSRMYPSVPVSQPSYTGAPPAKKAAYQLTYPCSDHPEEELTYYCFSCTRPICPECAIHGLHKDHEVQTTRKAIKQIKTLLV
jgi:hypothetical protein